MKREKRKIGTSVTAVLLCLLLVLSLYTPGVMAAESIDISKTASLTAQYQVKDEAGNEHPAVGISVQIYPVADVSAQTEFALKGDFQQYSVVINGLDSAGWRTLANTLAAYVARDKIAPLQSKQTDAAGNVCFENLPVGLYLVTAQQYEQDGQIYTWQPFLICLPNRSVDGQWLYNTTVAPKYDTNTSDERMVQKIWKDDGQEAKRPQAITVQLLKDGAVYDTVTLTAENNWRFTWSNLEEDAVWQVAEKDVPAGYTVAVEQQGSAFVMTNRQKPDGPSDEPDKPEQPPSTPEDPSTPDNPPEYEIPDEDVPQGNLEIPEVPDIYEEIPEEPVPQAGTESILPQTGVLWWPVPLLAGGGMVCYLIGWTRNRKSGEGYGK